MKKRFLNLFLALALVALVLPMAADAAGCQHNWLDGVCQNETCQEVCKHESKTWEITQQATCTSTGLTGGYVCDVCAKVISGHQVIPMQDHDWDDGTITKVATCKQEGEKSFGCIDCDATKTEKIEKLPCVIEKLDAVAPTCTKAGLTEGKKCTYCETADSKCAWCDASMQAQEEVPALGHKFGEGEVTSESTCTKKGMKISKCTVCQNASKIEYLPLAKHTVAGYSEVPPTCVEDGTTEGSKCSVCGEVIWGLEKIPATGEHTLSAKLETVSPQTCTEKEVALYKCRYCEYTEEVAIGEPKGHKTWPKEKIEPTCVEPGREAGQQCEYCKEFIEGGAEIPATGEHRLSTKLEIVTPATCTEKAVERWKCRYCDYTEEVAMGEPVGHKWQGFSEVAATCDKEGRTAGTWCWECEYVREGLEPIEKLPHTPGSMIRYITRPTCQETGLAEYKCTTCEDGTVTQVVRKLNCVFETVDAVAPTCNNTGWTEYQKCTSCGENQSCAYCAELSKGEVVPALGHNQVLNENHSSYKKPTCVEDGMDVFDCTRCGYDGVEVVVPALKHQRVETVMRAVTCTEPGRLYVECEREGCGYYWVEPVAPTGHTEEVVPAVDATCTATGLTEGKKCSVCGETLVAQTVTDKLSHDWKPEPAKDPTCQEDGWNAHDKCGICGETDGKTVIPASAAYHEYVNNKCKYEGCGAYDPAHQHEGELTNTNAATCTAAGKKFYECTGCDYTWEEDIAMLSHSYSATTDRCTGCGTMNPAHQHTYGTPVYTEATCTANGQVTKQCTVCGYEDVTTLNAKGHSYSNGVCVRCGTAAECTHAHTTTTTVREATCNASGQKVTTCNSCGAQTGTEPIPATGNHNYVNNRCTGCGKNDPNKITYDNQLVYPLG